MADKDPDETSVKTICSSDIIATVVILPETLPPVHIDLCNWDQVDEFLARDHDEYRDQWKLFILNGIHTKFAFELAMRMDIDPGFLDSHVYRSRYVPPCRGVQRIEKSKENVNGKGKCKEQPGTYKEDVDFFHLDFPQVEELCMAGASPASRGPQIPLRPSRWMLEEHVHGLAPDAMRAFLLDGTLYQWGPDLAGTFGYWRRMSYWSNEREKMSMMIIDGDMLAILPQHCTPMALSTRPFRHCVEKQNNNATEALDSLYKRWRTRHQPQSFLEKFLQDGRRDTIYEVATHVALQGWNKLLSAVQVDRGTNQVNALLGVISQRLEHNILDCNRLTSHPDEWEALKKHIPCKRDAALLQTITAFHEKFERIERRIPASPPPLPKHDKRASVEERQALNRLSYMVGILLPFSIVAGLFSMEGEFRAGGKLFFTYWVLVVPGVVVAMMAVYGDILRKRKVRVGSDSDSGSERVLTFRRRVYWGYVGVLRVFRNLRRRNRGSVSSSSSSNGSVSDIGRGEVVEVGVPQVPPPPGWTASSRTDWQRMSRENVKKDEETEELGWWRALRTLVGYKPSWADKD